MTGILTRAPFEAALEQMPQEAFGAGQLNGAIGRAWQVIVGTALRSGNRLPVPYPADVTAAIAVWSDVLPPANRRELAVHLPLPEELPVLTVRQNRLVAALVALRALKDVTAELDKRKGLRKDLAPFCQRLQLGVLLGGWIPVPSRSDLSMKWLSFSLTEVCRRMDPREIMAVVKIIMQEDERQQALQRAQQIKNGGSTVGFLPVSLVAEIRRRSVEEGAALLLQAQAERWWGKSESDLDEAHLLPVRTQDPLDYALSAVGFALQCFTAETEAKLQKNLADVVKQAALAQFFHAGAGQAEQWVDRYLDLRSAVARMGCRSFRIGEMRQRQCFLRTLTSGQDSARAAS